MKEKLIIILGQTATGKSSLAIDLAKKFDGEVLNADSLQVYKYLDIGTAKVEENKMSEVPHHLISIINPDEEYNAARFVSDARAKIKEINKRKKVPIVVGGTGLYIRCLLGGIFQLPADTGEARKKLSEELKDKGVLGLYDELAKMDPQSAAKISPNDKQRITRVLEVIRTSGKKFSKLKEAHNFQEKHFDSLKIGIKLPKEELLKRIKTRVDDMFEKGLVQEVETLLNKGYKNSLKALNSIGYKEAVEIIEGKTEKEEAVAKIYKRTKDYSKRQMTWFKKDSEIVWFDPMKEKREIFEAVRDFLKL